MDARFSISALACRRVFSGLATTTGAFSSAMAPWWWHWLGFQSVFVEVLLVRFRHYTHEFGCVHAKPYSQLLIDTAGQRSLGGLPVTWYPSYEDFPRICRFHHAKLGSTCGWRGRYSSWPNDHKLNMDPCCQESNRSKRSDTTRGLSGVGSFLMFPTPYGFISDNYSPVNCVCFYLIGNSSLAWMSMGNTNT